MKKIIVCISILLVGCNKDVPIDIVGDNILVLNVENQTYSLPISSFSDPTNAGTWFSIDYYGSIPIYPNTQRGLYDIEITGHPSNPNNIISGVGDYECWGNISELFSGGTYYMHDPDYADKITITSRNQNGFSGNFTFHGSTLVTNSKKKVFSGKFKIVY